PAPPGRGRYPITKLECPLVERASVSAVAPGRTHGLTAG
ncbi:MAG: LacI family transcriptional regulator, partial [Mesorhizobium sp.]